MAVMLFKISAISYLLMICSASAPTLLFGQNQAISSQSFVRQDVPLSYKYTTHHYPTEKTLQKKDTEQVASIQYAPLNSPDIHIRNEMDYFQKTNFNENAEVRKKQLEPNLGSYPHNSLPYVPGHNIEIFKSVNRSPGLPVEYRSIPETTDASTIEKGKVNYHRAFSVFKKPENIINLVNHDQEPIETIPPTNEPLEEYTRMFKLMTNANREEKYNPEPIKQLLDQQLQRDHQTLQDIHELTKQIEAQRVVGYPKMNTMLLNLARVYSPRVPSFNHVNYLDPVNENVISNLQNLIQARSPAMKYSEAKRSRILPMVLANSHLGLRPQ